MTMLKRMLLKGKVVTGDAMFYQRDLCKQVTDAERDYLFAVKDNQPDLKAAIEADFEPGFPPRYRSQTPAAACDAPRNIQRSRAYRNQDD